MTRWRHEPPEAKHQSASPPRKGLADAVTVRPSRDQAVGRLERGRAGKGERNRPPVRSRTNADPGHGLARYIDRRGAESRERQTTKRALRPQTMSKRPVREETTGARSSPSRPR